MCVQKKPRKVIFVDIPIKKFIFSKASDLSFAFFVQGILPPMLLQNLQSTFCVTFTREILNGKLHVLCSDFSINQEIEI